MAPDVAVGYFAVGITASQRAYHKFWLTPNHL